MQQRLQGSSFRRPLPTWRSFQRPSRTYLCSHRAWSSKQQTDQHSPLTFQELVLFIFQQEFDKQLQRALNYEDYDQASDVRHRRQTIDEALEKLQGHKGRFSEAVKQTFPSQEVQLRVQLQRAVDEQRYDDAADLRDRLGKLQQDMRDAAAAKGTTIEARQPRRFKLGQRVEHVTSGYRAVVYGWDDGCYEDDDWKKIVDITSLNFGDLQPFYHVLVDARDWPLDSAVPPVAYVPQEQLIAPQWPCTWASEKGADLFDHPMKTSLFLGEDDNGDLIPTRALREKHGQARQDIFPPDE